MLVEDLVFHLEHCIDLRTKVHLLSLFDNPSAMYRLTEAQFAGQSGLSAGIAGDVYRQSCREQALQEIEFCERHRIVPIVSGSEAYPPLLKECPDYPHILFSLGNTELLAGRLLSVAGTRRLTPYGAKMIEKILEELHFLYPDLVVVSGLTIGVDTHVHRTAMRLGMPTVSINVNPLNNIYPSSNTSLSREILRAGGLIITEHHSGSLYQPSNFLMMNRLIAGISEGTLIVESAADGNTIKTARLAESYHRTAMAIPGRVGDNQSGGTNFLIRKNIARLVRCGADIAEEMGWEIPEKTTATTVDTPKISQQAAALLKYFDQGDNLAVESLASIAGLSVSELSGVLFELEIDGIIVKLPGNYYRKN